MTSGWLSSLLILSERQFFGNFWNIAGYVVSSRRMLLGGALTLLAWLLLKSLTFVSALLAVGQRYRWHEDLLVRITSHFHLHHTILGVAIRWVGRVNLSFDWVLLLSQLLLALIIELHRHQHLLLFLQLRCYWNHTIDIWERYRTIDNRLLGLVDRCHDVLLGEWVVAQFCITHMYVSASMLEYRFLELHLLGIDLLKYLCRLDSIQFSMLNYEIQFSTILRLASASGRNRVLTLFDTRYGTAFKDSGCILFAGSPCTFVVQFCLNWLPFALTLCILTRRIGLTILLEVKRVEL